MAETELRIALLIDADNAPAAKIEPILTELARHGVANVRRAYGNWKNPHLKGWEETLHAYAIRPIQQFAYTSGKNASDMAMVIDAMDLLYARTLDGFAIVSSDADFTPLVMRLRNENMRVFGFGEEKTPLPFVKACSTFLYVEKLGATADEDKSPTVKPKRSEDLRGDATLVHLLRNAVSATANDDGWSHLGVVGSHIRNQTSFDERNYGYRNLSALIEATGLFELRREGQMVEIRELPKAKPKPKSKPSRSRKKTAA
ncbi:NYN domain-containing protein [Luteimonas salinilitoris]|uniref:NYN domain-containing protein n=1 Tax=Luteimonas salinilitoris TaxID=3237697 RepID=A0ABV4HVH5_9GAMM